MTPHHEAFDLAEEGTPAIFLTSDAAKTSRTKRARRLEIMSCDSEQFSRDDAALTYSHEDKRFYVVRLPEAEEMARAQARAPSPISLFLAAKEGNVSFNQLSAEHQKLFEAARAKEANSLVSAGAVRALTLEEPRQFEERHPECVLDSLWAERWKATDEKELLAKSRWWVVGWQDPDIHEIERSSPMPRDETINVAAQIIASRQWELRFRDVKAAFSQSLKSNRRRPIACKQPRGLSLIHI